MATFDSNRDAKANVGTQGIIVEDEGGVVAGGPHTTLDFVGGGVTVSDGGGGTATITIPGGGGGTDTYTAPNEYYVDPALAADATKRQYQTIAAALTAAGSSTSQVVVRLVEGVSHLWDGSGLDPTVSLAVYSTGTSTLHFDTSTTISTDGSVLIRHLYVESRGVSASGTFTVTTAPLVAGDLCDLNSSFFTGVVGARTPGSYDWDTSLGTVELLAAEIAAAINDPQNGGGGVVWGHGITAAASGAVVTLTVDIPGTAGNSFPISATTTPAGGITVVGMSGGSDVALAIAVPTLRVEDCTGSLVFTMPDGPTPAAKVVRIDRSDLDLQVVAGGDTRGGSFEVADSIIRVAANGLVGGLWYHGGATTAWSLLVRKTLLDVRPVDPDPIISSQSSLLAAAFQDVTMVLYNDTSPMVVQTGGEAGPTWETSRILEGGIRSSTGGFLFGDVGTQFGLAIEHQSNGLFPSDAPDGTVARSQTYDEAFSIGLGPVTFSLALRQWRGANNSVMLGGAPITSNAVPEWFRTATENDPFVNITGGTTQGIYSVKGRVIAADTDTLGQSAV